MKKSIEKRIISLDNCKTGMTVRANLFDSSFCREGVVCGLLKVVEEDGKNVVYLKHTNKGWKKDWMISEANGTDNLLPNENCKSLIVIG